MKSKSAFNLVLRGYWQSSNTIGIRNTFSHDCAQLAHTGNISVARTKLFVFKTLLHVCADHIDCDFCAKTIGKVEFANETT